MSTTSHLIELRDIRFHWPKTDQEILRIPYLLIDRGEHVFIKGPSGSGKSTLLNMVAGVLQPQQGEVRVLSHNFSDLNVRQRDQMRCNHIGFVFQQFNLIPYLGIIENVILPCRFSKIRRDKAVARSGSVMNEAKHLLSNLFDDNPPDLNRPVTDLSTGQQQRVAAARALMGQPDLVIADEPTSSLDFEAREAFMTLLFDEVRRANATLIFVSHDPTLQTMFGRKLEMNDINQCQEEQSI